MMAPKSKVQIIKKDDKAKLGKKKKITLKHI